VINAQSINDFKNKLDTFWTATGYGHDKRSMEFLNVIFMSIIIIYTGNSSTRQYSIEQLTFTSQNDVKTRNCNFCRAKRKANSMAGMELGFRYFIPPETYGGHRAEAKKDNSSII